MEVKGAEMNDEQKSSMESNLVKSERKSKWKKILITLFLCLLVLFSTVFVLYKLGYWGNKEISVGNVKDGELPGLIDDQLKAALQEKADKTAVTVQINSRPVFKNGSSEGALYLGNPKTNLYDMRVKIKLKATGEEIFNSDLIKPNQYIDYAKLNKNFEMGEYEAIASVNYYDGITLVSTSEFSITIVVLD